MKIVKANYIIMKPDIDDPRMAQAIYHRIANVARVCYKSSNDADEEKDIRLIRQLIKNGHEAMLEHENMTVKFIVDRGISHELVRHRLASFAQESTRYCNYSKDKFGEEITVVEPVFFLDIPEKEKEMVRTAATKVNKGEETQFFLDDMVTDKHIKYLRWFGSCAVSEINYFGMLELGATPEEARSVLPTSLKTEVVMTANMREWRHILNLRAAGVTGKPHPQMLEVMVPLLNELRLGLPVLFEDIHPMEDNH